MADSQPQTNIMQFRSKNTISFEISKNMSLTMSFMGIFEIYYRKIHYHLPSNSDIPQHLRYQPQSQQQEHLQLRYADYKWTLQQLHQPGWSSERAPYQICRDRLERISQNLLSEIKTEQYYA